MSLSWNFFGFSVLFFAYLIAMYIQPYDVQAIIDREMGIVLILAVHRARDRGMLCNHAIHIAIRLGSKWPEASL
jgi:hypothetical protein